MAIPLRRSNHFPRRFALAVLYLVGVLSIVASGGGGGGSSSGPPAGGSSGQPTIAAIVISFPAGAAPPDFAGPGFNTVAVVAVLNQPGTAPIATASVTLNGAQIPYSSTFQDYAAAFNLNPGASVNLSVTVGGTTYSASTRQFYAYPSIISPAANTTWSSEATNLISWSGTSPSSTAQFALGLIDTAGNFVWPVGDEFFSLPSSASDYTIDANVLSAGSWLLLVGIVDGVPIAGATPGSGIVIGGFNYAPIDVSSTPPGPTETLQYLTTIPATATLGLGKTKQLAVIGTYSDGSTEDLTTRAAWSSSETTKVSVSNTGLAEALAYGSSTISAEFNGLTATTHVIVFEPNPSPLPPLSESAAYQIDYAHSGHATIGGSGPSFPPSAQWTTTLNGRVSYPVIAEGKVIVMTDTNPTGASGGTSLYALDQTTGDISWGPVEIPDIYSWAGHAYDHSRVFVVSVDGMLRTFEVGTGAAGWSRQLPGQYFFTAPPTAVNGIVYIGGSGSGGTVYAVDEATAELLWTATVANGGISSPTVSADGVFVAYPCQVYKFDPIVGTPLWHYAGPCSGGGGETAAFADGQLYVRDPTNPPDKIFDASNGVELGTFSSTTIPALTSQAAYFLVAGTLTAVDRATQDVLWTFTGDGDLRSVPIVIDSVVVIGSGNGAVYALDDATGAIVWSGQAVNAIEGPDQLNAYPLTGLGVGGGYLVVPAGNAVQAWKIAP